MVLKPKMIINVKLKSKKFILPEDFVKNGLNCMIAVELLKHVIKFQSDPIMTYKELALKISPDFNPQNLNVYLGNISNVCKENGLPLVSAIVVYKDTRLPGEGFYREFYPERPISEWEEIFKKCKIDIVNCIFWKDLLDEIEQY